MYYRVYEKGNGYVVVEAKNKEDAKLVASKYQESDIVIRTTYNDYSRNLFRVK